MMNNEKHNMSFLDFMPTIKGIIIAAVGWTIASIQSFTSFLQVLSASEIEMWDAWISLAIKGVTLITGIVLLFYNINKIRKQNMSTNLMPGGDNEDGSGSEIDPDDPDQEA